MIHNYSLNDKSANIAYAILKRGHYNIQELLNRLYGKCNFDYVACPDFSISLITRRLILGLPIGGYVKFPDGCDIFPTDLDLSTCGIYVAKIRNCDDINDIVDKIIKIKHDIDNEQFKIDNCVVKWNFTKRNHFMNVYKDDKENYYLVLHSSSGNMLDIDCFKSLFKIKTLQINDDNVNYVDGKDALSLYKIAMEESEFFHKRQKKIVDEILGSNYELMIQNQHFGMVKEREVLMGCTKAIPGTLFPLATRPFSDIYLAKANNAPNEILKITDGYSLVPHGLGIEVPEYIKSIVPYKNSHEYMDVLHENGSRMIATNLEYIGINYRTLESINEMKKLIDFSLEEVLHPVILTKL